MENNSERVINSSASANSKDGEELQTTPCCCNELIFKRTDDATGIGMVSLGNGPLMMSNIFLATAFITLGEKEIGCYSEDDGTEIECGKVYGFKPSSLVSNIAVISGLLIAFFLPIIGAIIDCTSYRRNVGITSTTLMMIVQAIQVGTVQSTWFAMLILQTINGFIYRARQLAQFSYYPELAREVGIKTMTRYTADYTALFNIGQVIFLLTVIIISILMDLGDIGTAQLGQFVCVLFSGLAYSFGWHFIGSKPAARQVPEGSSLVSAGFKQVFQTCCGIWKYYRPSLGWYLFAVMFSESGVYAFTTVSVTFLSEVLDMSGTEVGIIFLIVLICCVPGAYIGMIISKKANPKTSMRINLILFIALNFPAFLLMTDPDQKTIAYIFGIAWGILIGWFYATEDALYSNLVPPGQESELTGFYLYCTQILSFFPPMIFTIMNESDIPLGWGGVHLNIYLFIALIIYQFAMADWDTCIESVKVNLMKENEATMKEDSFQDYPLN